MGKYKRSVKLLNSSLMQTDADLSVWVVEMAGKSMD